MMHLEQYTADAICHSMGIGPFADPSWDSGTVAIRLVLEPSFHPEACITITQRDGLALLSVTVLADRLWGRAHPCQLPAHRDESELTKAEFTDLADFHHEAIPDRDARPSLCLDGMGVHCAWTTGHGCGQFESNVCQDSLREFVGQMIDQAWHDSTNPGVRNGLADCARYIGAEYPADPIPSQPTLFRLGVFGTADDVDEFFSVLKRAQRKAEPSGQPDPTAQQV